MTTLAIIGSGILGRSLIYTLAKEQKHFEKITLFCSDEITFPCTYNSTAIVAPRGLSAGHSPLGDMLMDGYRIFSNHVALDCPDGVESIIQYTGATTKLDQFKERYPDGKVQKLFLKDETYIAEEKGFLIEPRTYSEWLLKEARMMEKDHLEEVNDLVTEIQENERLHIKTASGRNLSFDVVVFAGGIYNQFWKDIAPDSVLKTSKSVQGSYLEFNNVDLGRDSFSLTLNGDNLVWNNRIKRLLIGSTTLETIHLLHPEKELNAIYDRIKAAVDLNLPERNLGEVKIGLREKAKKREPYIVKKGHIYFAGGLYKNGFTLSLKMTRSLSHQLP